MWKYVSRRIRDVCDRTQTILEARRPWPTGDRICSDRHQPSSTNPVECDGSEENVAKGGAGSIRGSYCLVNVVQQQLERIRQGRDTGSSGYEREGTRKQKDYNHFQHSWIGAITWTSAIICGWYTSQLVCLYRRHHKWDGPKCMPFLISAAHRLPRETSQQGAGRSIGLYCPFSGPPAPPIESIPRSDESKGDRKRHQVVTFFGVPIPTAKVSRLSEFDFENFPASGDRVVYRINNEVDTPGKEKVLPVPKQESVAPTVESAMENLLTVIGEIEYQLGVQCLEVGDYRMAVSHLKLGTSHQHAGAAFNLGICYEQGFGVKKSAKVAMECFHMASNLGHAMAMYNLGVYYARGLGGLRRNRSMAKKYFTAAADAGVQEAITALGPGYIQSRRESWSSDPSSSSSSPTAVPFEFTFNHIEEQKELYPGFDAALAEVNANNTMEPVGLRLLSVMS